MKEKLTIGYSELKISLPLLVAYEEKLFLKYKLDNIELRAYSNAQSLMDDLSSHKIHLGGYTALPIAFSAMGKTKLLFIGGIYESDEYPISFLLVRKENNEINSIEDLKGKKIGILPTKAYRIWIETILKKEGLSLSDIAIIDVENEKHEEYLKSKEIDALFTNDPMASNIIAEGIGVRLSEKALVPHATGIHPFYFGSFNITSQFAKNNTDIVRKITLALDEAILIIAKNPYIVEKSLTKYLHMSKEFIETLTNTNFKTSKNVSNNDLSIMQLYYFQQNLYRNKITTEYLQYHYTGKIYRFLRYIDKIVIPFLEKNWKIGTLITVIAAAIISFLNTRQHTMEENRKHQKELIELLKSQQAQFLLEYYKYDTYNQPIKLVNIGHSSLKNLRVHIEIYFVSDTYKIYSASNLKQIATIDENILKLFQKEKIINEPKDFIGMFDTNRIYELSSLEGDLFSDSSNRNKMDLDLGSFSQVNAVKFSKILEMQIIIRLKIKYNEDISEKSRMTNKYIWLEEDDDNKTIRHDLEDIYGGKKIIREIKKYEDTTKNVIFN